MLNVDCKEMQRRLSKTSNSSHLFHSTTFGPPIDPKNKNEIHELLDVASQRSLGKASTGKASQGKQKVV